MAKQIKILIDSLRLRETPSLSGKILGYAEKGVHSYSDVVSVPPYFWYHIENGYVANVQGAVIELTLPEPATEDSSRDQVYVSDIALSIRSKPTTSSDRLGICARNSYYDVLDFEERSDYTWYKIGSDAWVAGIDELTYYPAGSSHEGQVLKADLEKLQKTLQNTIACISKNEGQEYYDDLRSLVSNLNSYIEDHFDFYQYDYVDSNSYDEIDLLYTADVHGAWVGYDEDGNYLNPVFNYDDIESYRSKLAKKNIKALLVDCGDWSRPCRVYKDYMNTGEMVSATQMNKKKYFAGVYGNHEWKWGSEDKTLEILNKNNCITACNMFKNGKLVFKPYRTAKIGSHKIAVIGIGYPSPNGQGSYSDGVWSYGGYQFYDDKKLFNQVQKCIDELKANGFEHIIAICHMCKSTYESDSRYKARTDSLIKNTSGLTAVLQGHYNFATNAETVPDKSGKPVLLAHESGANMNSFGRLRIKGSEVSSYLLDERSDLDVI